METKESILTGGIFRAECWRLVDPLTGKRLRDSRGRFLERQLAWVEETFNKVTNEGLDKINNVFFYTTAKLSNAWYLALVNTNTTAASTMTYAVPVYTESVAYSGNRPACTFAASSSQIVTNSASPATFTMTGSETEYGASLVGANAAGVLTPGDTAASGGVLLSYGKFGTARSVVATDIINLTYTMTSASST